MTYKNLVFRSINKILPKTDKVLVIGSEKIASNAVGIANALEEQVDKKIYMITSKKFKPSVKKMVHPDIKLVNSRSLFSFFLLLTSRYVFSTHGNSLTGSSKRQLEVNIWHGVLYKNIRKLRGEEGIDAQITAGTSPLSQKMFSEAFGVSKESVLISGYPRNDIMLQSQRDLEAIKKRITPDLTKFKKMAFWMPTFRRNPGNEDSSGRYGMKLDNPFQVENFDVNGFNELLKEQETLCLLKPHYFYLTDKHFQGYSNIMMIDDEWIGEQGITLYHLLGIVDILISDFSSVIIDFILLNRPIVCFCTDLEEYKRTQGLYFEDIENWLPTKLIQQQDAFFQHLRLVLSTGNDPFEDKRKSLEKEFFTYSDAHSSQRIIEHVFGNKTHRQKISGKEFDDSFS